MCDSVRVITNGLRLPRVPKSFWEVVDEISVSVYPGRELPRDQAVTIERTAAACNVALKFKYFNYFRESYSEIGTSDVSLVQRIYRTCQMASTWRCHTVWRGRLYRCPQSLFLPLALDGTLGSTEGIEINETADFLARLLDFLEDPRPLSSCRHCLGSVGRIFTNSQVPRSGWRDPQRTPTEYLVDRKHLHALEKNPKMIVKDSSYITGEAALER